MGNTFGGGRLRELPVGDATGITKFPMDNFGATAGAGPISGLLGGGAGLVGGGTFGSPTRLPGPPLGTTGRLDPNSLGMITNMVGNQAPQIQTPQAQVPGVAPAPAPALLTESEWNDKYRQEADKRAKAPSGIVSDIVTAPGSTPITPVTPATNPLAPKPAVKGKPKVETNPYERWKQLGRPGGNFEAWKKKGGK